MPRKPLSISQIVCVTLLWILIVVYILTHSRIDGPLVLSLILSGLLVFIPVYQTIRKRFPRK
ncbi:MAG: hypothetical protein SPI72_00570 [Porphyromonas sp.]|nr:hypothetical protein [Porphyromonas sp.]